MTNITIPDDAQAQPVGFHYCCGSANLDHEGPEPCSLVRPQTLATELRRVLVHAHMQLVPDPDAVPAHEWQRVRSELASWLGAWTPRIGK